jgi:uncharacterized protein (TIGR02118 family)
VPPQISQLAAINTTKGDAFASWNLDVSNPIPPCYCDAFVHCPKGTFPPMVTISVLYPKTDQSTFDYSYYTAKHLPIVRERWGSMGLVSLTPIRGVATLDGSTPSFEFLGLLAFESMEAMQAALAAHGAEVIGDVPNFTNVTPIIQVNQPIEFSL